MYVCQNVLYIIVRFLLIYCFILILNFFFILLIVLFKFIINFLPFLLLPFLHLQTIYMVRKMILQNKGFKLYLQYINIILLCSFLLKVKFKMQINIFLPLLQKFYLNL
mmetsp:Transcript_11207/g.1000  ORF Transcript_11207/g.1000 Transcript_11207/m.1000 type:complete len:108 (-) Transcript_11207:288-611(-)